MVNKFKIELVKLRGVVAHEILDAAMIASDALDKAGIPHALCGGLAVSVHGYRRTTDDVDFLVNDQAFEKHDGGVVTLKVPIISVGGVRIDFVSDATLTSEEEWDRHGIVSMRQLVWMKLTAARQRDLSDLVELIKRGRINVPKLDEFLRKKPLAAMSTEVYRRWLQVKHTAWEEEGK